VRIVETTITDKVDQIAELLRAHWDEIALNKDVMVLKPDVDKYRQLESMGLVLTLVAYDDDDQIIGYSINFIQHHLHYADLKYVANDVLFVRQDLRGSTRIGRQLIAETEAKAKAIGAQLVLWHAKEGTALATLLPRIGYQVQDIVFSKRA